MRILLFSIISITIIFNFAISFALDYVLKVRVTEFPPQYYIDSSGNWAGLDIELAKTVVEEARLEYVFITTSWAAGLEHLKSGEIDMMMTVSKNAERSKYINWIGPERKARMALVVSERNKNLPIKELDDFVKVSQAQKVRFGVQENVHYSNEFNEKLKDTQFMSCFEFVKNVKLNPRKVRANRILGFFEDKISMVYHIKNNPDFKGLAIHPFILKEEDVFFGISKKTPSRVHRKLLDAFRKLHNDGTLESLYRRYSN